MIPVCANKFFHLPVCLGKDSLVVNTGRSSISLVQHHTHKLLQTWTLKQPRSFSCPVVYVHHKNKILCVIDKHVVVAWNYEADSLDGAKEIKFQDVIFSVLPVENHRLVVFNSGSCILMEDALTQHEFVMQPYLKNEENLLWVGVSAYKSKLFIFLLTSMHKVGHKLHALLLNISDRKIEKLSEQVISRNSSSLQSWCIKPEDAEISFITTWSDGQVHSYSMCSKPSTHLLTIPGIQEKELLAVEALDSCHIVVVRCCPSYGCSYEIWDTRYATRKTQKSVELAFPENLQIRVLDETLFIHSSQGIMAEPLKVSLPMLSAVVGKLSSTDEVQDVIYLWTPDGQLLREDVEETCTDISDCKFSAITRNEIFQELLSRLHGQDDETILSCLREVKLISESKLAELLQYLLRENYSELKKKSSKRRQSTRNSEKNTEKIFLELFRIPCNDIYLQQHLRKLTFKEVVATLKILNMLLRDISLYDDRSTYTQIVNWTCLLLFSHFEEFITSTVEEMLLLEDVLKVIINKFANSDEVEDLLQLKHKKLNFDSSASIKYCVEHLYL